MTEQTNDLHIREHVYRLLYEELGLCCGFPEDSYDLVRDLLTAFRSKTDALALLPDAGARYLVLAVLDRAGLIEHGSIIDTAWLTRKGEWYWHGLTRFDSDDIDGADGVGLPHDGKACMDSCLKPFWGLH
ncbi:hypothetical protein [Streptomyces sp. NPDC007991]|uniref:hypothetical protein n=1 Tax=Streptomyces sp. NPDC007991 TaxID=3364803 RepID=UPI0036E7EE6F